MLESLHKHNYKTVENSAGCFILAWSQVNQKASVKYLSSLFFSIFSSMFALITFTMPLQGSPPGKGGVCPFDPSGFCEGGLLRIT